MPTRCSSRRRNCYERANGLSHTSHPPPSAPIMAETSPPRSQSDLADQIERATDALRRGHLAEAEGLYRAVLSADPHNFQALHRLGVLKLREAAFEEASGFITRAIAVDPSAGTAWSNLGSVQLTMRRYEEALASFDRA